MKVLYYNWVDFLHFDKWGGGVTVYQKNVIDSLVGSADLDISFISSGTEHSVYPKHPHVKELKPHNGSRRFELINSEVVAPGHLSFDDPASIDAPATRQAFADFIRVSGGFDVIHFNNLEGLPANVLELKKEFPNTRFIFALHNYYSVCPQVNLWWREKQNCEDYHNGRNCPACLDYEPNSVGAKNASLVSRGLIRVGISPQSRLHQIIFRTIQDIHRVLKLKLNRSSSEVTLEKIEPRRPSTKTGKSGKPGNSRNPPFHQQRREQFAHYINSYCDRVLAVSDRVAEVVIKFGLDPELIQTSYIGTKVAETFTPPDVDALAEQLREKETITIGYLGYMRRDKGFYFLMDALESLPESLTSRINVVIAAQLWDSTISSRLALMAESFNSVYFSDGYTHDMLDDLYNRLDLSLVPVLWEDNLPQVSIESACHHTPVLSSDLGGAKEVGGSNPHFVFKAGDVDDFAVKLGAFANDPMLLLDYWNTSRQPVTMDMHLADLRDIYQCEIRPLPAAASDDVIASESALATG